MAGTDVPRRSFLANAAVLLARSHDAIYGKIEEMARLYARGRRLVPEVQDPFTLWQFGLHGRDGAELGGRLRHLRWIIWNAGARQLPREPCRCRHRAGISGTNPLCVARKESIPGRLHILKEAARHSATGPANCR